MRRMRYEEDEKDEEGEKDEEKEVLCCMEVLEKKRLRFSIKMDVSFGCAMKHLSAFTISFSNIMFNN